MLLVYIIQKCKQTKLTIWSLSVESLKIELKITNFESTNVPQGSNIWIWRVGSVSISSTFCEQLLQTQILKAQNRLTTWVSFFAFLGSARRTLMKFTPYVIHYPDPVGLLKLQIYFPLTIFCEYQILNISII